jgi:alpha(1,3/1,4) fucosyltransferase
MKFLLLSLVLGQMIFADQVLILPTGPSTDPTYYQQMLSKDTAQVIDLSYFGAPFEKEKHWITKFFANKDFKYPLDKEVKKIVCMNIPNHFFRDFKVRSLPKEKMVLFMWEPYIRMRKLYNQNLHDCFSKIYTWNDDLVDNVKYFKFNYPVLRPMTADVVPFDEKKLCTLVTGYVNNPAKYPGEHPNELYTERFKAVEFFEKVGETSFDVYGRGWERAPPCNSFRGPCQDKQQVIKNYKFSLCYENCRDVKGYITEKIFDCFAAGSVPIYWGAPNVGDYIPTECFIDRREFATLDDLYLFLKTMTKERYDAYLQSIRNFLDSDAAQAFSEEHFEKLFREAAR